MQALISSGMRYIRRHGEQFSRLAGEGAYVLLGQIAAVLGSLVLVRVLTEYLEPAQYGQLALSMTAAGLMNQLIMGAVSNGIGRFYSVAVENNDAAGYYAGAVRLFAYAAATVCVSGGLLLTWLPYAGIVLPLIAVSIVNGCASALNNLQNASRRRAMVALHGAMDAWLRVALTYAVLVYVSVAAAAVLFAYALGSLLVCISQFLQLPPQLRHRMPHTSKAQNGERWTKQIWAFSWPFAAWGVFTWAQQASDRWALQAFTSTTQVGQYAVAFQLSFAPIGMATGLFISLVSPILFEQAGDASDPRRNARNHAVAMRLAVLGLCVTGAGFLFTLAFHESIFRLLVAASFRSASRFLPWLVLAGGLFAAGQTLSLKFLSEIRPQVLLRVKIATATLGAIANVAGARAFGVTGVIAAVLLFSATYFAWMLGLALSDNTAAANPRSPSAQSSNRL
jgi:O-antigen/teichoic acid export membrane protein